MLEKLTKGLLVLAAAAGIGLAPQAQAQGNWPQKPITVMVPFAAGGVADVLARIVGERASRGLGQPLVFENRSGAGGNIGITAVARATGDGYTIGIGTTGALSINPHLFKARMPFDALKDVRPLVIMATQPNLIVVNNDLPVKTLAELIAYLKANPDRESYGSSGIGTSQHLCMELFAQQTGIKAAHVPYRASNQILQDLISGQIKMACDNFAAAYEQVKAGTVRALAVTTLEPYAGSPGIPTAAETLPGFEVTVFHGYIAPASLPEPIVQRLIAELRAAVADPDVQARLRGLGVEPSGLADADFARFLKAQYDKWGTVVEASGLKLQ